MQKKRKKLCIKLIFEAQHLTVQRLSTMIINKKIFLLTSLKY